MEAMPGGDQYLKQPERSSIRHDFPNLPADLHSYPRNKCPAAAPSGDAGSLKEIPALFYYNEINTFLNPGQPTWP